MAEQKSTNQDGNSFRGAVDKKLSELYLPPDFNGPRICLGYYPEADLLLLRCGMSESTYLTVNRQNLIRFFPSYQAMTGWLCRNRYDAPGKEPPPVSAEPTAVPRPTFSLIQGDAA